LINFAVGFIKKHKKLSSLREKSQVFIIGLLIGLLVAGGFFVFKLDDYFKELNFYKRFAETFEDQKKGLLQHKMQVQKKQQDSKKSSKKEQIINQLLLSRMYHGFFK
jgi:hypothetical protein